MKTSRQLIVLFLTFGIYCALAAEKDPPDASAPPANSIPSWRSELARVRFMPASAPMKGRASYDGASQTALVQGPQKGILWLQAHARIGDKFPVQMQGGVTLFEVVLVAGDDDHLVLEIRSKEGSQKINLPRDKDQTVEVAGVKYELLYPSISVAAAGNERPTTNKAMLMVKRRL